MLFSVKRFFRLGCLIILGGTLGCSGWRGRALPINPPYAALETAAEETNSHLLARSEKWMCDEWWMLNDTQLTHFVLTALARNPTLQAAQANIALAIANAESVRARLLPLLIGSADASAQKISKTGIIPFGNTNFPNTPSSMIPIIFQIV